MSRCTAPVYGHRTASGAANCPACGSRSYYKLSPSYYTPQTRPSWSGGGGSSSGGSSGGSFAGSSGGGKSRRLRGGGAVAYTATEWRTIEPLARQAEEQAREHPERRDLFLCHAWDDREGAARELCDLLVSLGATVWFSEKDVGLGKSLLREIDKCWRTPGSASCW